MGEPRPPSASNKICPICHYWLSKALVSDGERYHPTCDPNEPSNQGEQTS